MWSHSQQWLPVPLWSEVHCYWSSVDLCGLWLNHNRPETSWYQGTSVRAGGTRHEIWWWGVCSWACLIHSDSIKQRKSTDVLRLVCDFGEVVLSHKAPTTLNLRERLFVCVFETESRWSDQAEEEGQEEETEITSGPAGYLLSVLPSRLFIHL